jgi:hypothetical protein
MQRHLRERKVYSENQIMLSKRCVSPPSALRYLDFVCVKSLHDRSGASDNGIKEQRAFCCIICRGVALHER